MRPWGTLRRAPVARSSPEAEGSSAPGVTEDNGPTRRAKLAPLIIAYAMGPTGLIVLLLLRQKGLVARDPIWAYLAVFVGTPLSSFLTDRFIAGRDDGRLIHLRVAVHVTAVTLVIYMTGWGPEVVGAYGFIVVDNISRSGSRVWKIVAAWVIFGVACGQLAVWVRIAPSFIPAEKAAALALMGLLIVLFVARMLGATSQQKELAEQALRSNEERFRSLVQNSYDAMIVTSQEGAITFASPAIQSLIGLTPEQVTGEYAVSLIHPEDHDRVGQQISVRLQTARTTEPLQFRMAHTDGTWRHVEAVLSDLRDRKSIAGYVANLRDVTERRRAEEALEHQALHDPLTALPNRALLGDRIGQAILRGARADTPSPVVMFLDLDRFKLVNDSLGHAAGDKVLVEVADRLRTVMRASDTLARFGGDEFVMLCEQIADREALLMVAERILAALEPPFFIEDREFHVGASIGAAVIEGDNVTADELLSDADSAMYLAKTRSGRSRIQIFDHAVRTMARHRTHTEGELAHALEHGEMVVHYQPIIDLWTRRRVGVEALVRWQHPKRGLLMPSDFLDLAEQTGLIVPIGAWVMRQACAQVRDWNNELSTDHQLALSVNLSARQLSEPDLVDDVSSVLVDAGISPKALRLVLDLTESLLLFGENEAATHVRQLHRIGVTLAIDDFGTGYSSLQYMRELPIGVVKIDRTFISSIGSSTRDEAIIRSMVDLAHTLGITVAAEGVENALQLEFISEIGCDLAQGYFFGAPAPAEEIDVHCRTVQALTITA
ncbi:MAG: EAL domain-containing protein [Acidimicrobiales bacterium]